MYTQQQAEIAAMAQNTRKLNKQNKGDLRRPSWNLPAGLPLAVA
jgi:hypothetical protein